MLLTVDIGNSFVKAGLWDGETLLGDAPLRLPTVREKTANEYADELFAAAREAGLSDALSRVRAAVLASVVPQLTQVWTEIGKRFCDENTLVVTSQTDTGLQTRYQTQATLGTDRWVNAFAAYALLGANEANKAAIVVDFGTATKWEAVAPSGVYLGGAIAPGVGTSRDALFSRAAQLSTIPLDLPAPVPVIGNSTQTALQAGILRGAAGTNDQIIAAMQNEMGVSSDDCRVWATGGLAPLVVPHCQTPMTAAPHLTLAGLRLLHDRQQK